ncbi:recombinase family protein [Novipirellula sp. SH528]|uniref:recombinase family protein n=1 Tax=Novipirellula sp. SH528 TaxID=3454466 RepID=UPI003FA11CB8
MLEQPVRCAIYARQSRVNGREFSSCDLQRQICMHTAANFSWKVVDVFEDAGQSSESLARAEMQRLLAGVELDQFDRVIVYSIDRLTRRLFDFARLMDIFDRFGVALTVVTDPNFNESASSRFTSNIIAAASEFQQQLTRERMAESRAALKSRGQRVAGLVPFGYTIDRIFNRLVAVPEDSVVVCDFFKLAERGRTPAEIADLANRREGGQTVWNARRLLQILSNPVYAGYLPGDAKQRGNHEAIVTPEQFERVRQQVKARQRRAPQKRDSNEDFFPLRGLLHCAKCGRALNTNTSTRGNIRYRWYQCRSHAGGRPPCPKVSLPAWDIEEFVAARLSGWSTDSDVEERFSDEWKVMVTSERQSLLKEFVLQIDYDSDSRDIGFTFKDDAIELFASPEQ